MDALELAAGDAQVARLGRAGGQDDGVKFFHELFGRIIFPDFGVATEDDALGLHLLDAAHDDFLLVEFHVGDAVHEQAAGAVGALEDGDEVAGLVKLRGGAEARGAGADDGDFFAGAARGRLGHDPALLPALVGNDILDVLDGNGRIVDAQDAGAFARGGADTAGEVGEIVGLVEAVEGLAPEAAIDQVVPFGDEVVDGAAAGHAVEEPAGVAEGDAAIHAARALLAQLRLFHVEMKFLPIRDALGGGRSAGSSRRYSMNPLGSPIAYFLISACVKKAHKISRRRRGRRHGCLRQRRP